MTQTIAICLTRIGGQRSVWAVGGVETSGRHTQGAGRAFIRAAIFMPGFRVFSLRREGGEYKTRKGNKPAQTSRCLGRVCLGFYPPATSGAVESFVGGVFRQPRSFQMANATPATIPSALNLSDLNTTINHEPRIRDLTLAERLGFADLHKVRTLIERNRPELETYGEVSATAAETSAKGGRPGREYWLNEGQALTICALSRTPQAADIRRQVIQVYMDWRRGHHGAALSQAGMALVRLGARTVTIDLAGPSQGGEGPWLVTPHGRTMPEIVETVRFDVPGPMAGAGRTVIVPGGPSGRYAALWGRVVGHATGVTTPSPTVPGATDTADRPLVLTEQEIMVALAFRTQVERGIQAGLDAAVQVEVRRHLDDEATKLRREVTGAVICALDSAILARLPAGPYDKDRQQKRLT